MVACSLSRLLFFALLFSFQAVSCQHSVKPAAPEGSDGPRSIWATEWSADGKYIALGGDDSTVWIYDAGTYRVHRTFKSNSMVKGLGWHPKENLLAIANMKGVQLLDLEAGTLATVPGLRGGGRGIGWNFTGELLALADSYGVIQLMDRSGKLLRSIPKQDNKSYLSLDWHPSKNVIATGGDEIILFDTSGREISNFRVRDEYTAILSVKWHPSGSFLASGDYGHEKEGRPTLLQFWKEDGTKLKEMNGHHEEIRNLRWSGDGRYLATAADALRIWNMDGELEYSGAVEANLWGVAWSNDDKFIVTGTFANGKVKLWDSQARLIRELNP